MPQLHPPKRPPRPPGESDVRADRAQQRTLQCLQSLCQDQKEAMFLISELDFSDFLSKRNSALAPSAPKDPEDRGDFDILLIHPHFGILVGEVKSIGFQSQDFSDKDLRKRLEKIVKQLDKSERFVKRAVADIAPNILIRKTVILPYVSRRRLEDFLGQNSPLQENLRVCVGAQKAEDIFQLCLLKDQMSGHSDSLQVPDTVKAHLETWWKTRMACMEDPGMSEDLYLQLLARFCGPATTVRVYCPERPNLALRTDSEAVSAIGEKISSIMLTADQFSLVQYDQRKLVFLTGPPGTGKSIVLLLKGVRWLSEGHDVHVVSTRLVSYAVCSQIEHQLKKMKSGEVGSGEVYFHDYDFWNRPDADGEKAVAELKNAAAREGKLYVLLDEYSTNPDFIKAYANLLTSLNAACPKLHVWTAAVRDRNIPSLMSEAPMVVPLRYPREVLAEVQKEMGKSEDIHKYDTSRVDHLPDLWQEIKHLSHDGEGHKGDWPVDCFQCGSDIGQILMDELHIGGAASASADTSPPPLQFSDVFILTRSSQLQDSSPFVQGLRDRQIPVLVLSDPIEEKGQTPADNDQLKELKKQLARVARLENEGQVVVARYGLTCGLERKVVVCLTGRIERFDDGRSKEELIQRDGIHGMSRSLAYLIIVSKFRTSKT